jgi:hypothetical protein
MTTSTLYDLYRAPLNVWVEDPTTHSVLTELWGDPQINVIVAGGRPGVAHMVRSAPRSFKNRIFGIVDRDFDDDNEGEWEQAHCAVLRLPVHEMENLLLDFDTLCALSKRESAADIRERTHAHATRLLFWMVCKAVLRQMQSELSSGFPTDPPMVDTLSSLNDVEQYLSQSGHLASRDAAVRKWGSGVDLTRNLQTCHDAFEGIWAGEEWARCFSGKEILRHLRSHVAGLDETPKRPPQPSPADRDLDLAKRIARKMRETSRIPPVITRLRSILRARVGL